MRIGIIGCGALGLVHAQRLGRLPDIEIAGVSDPFEVNMEKIAIGMENRPARYQDYRDLLANVKLDAVCIASPDAFHVQQVLDSLDCGLHVLCEKPLTPSEADLDAVINARDRTGRLVSLTYPRRYDVRMRLLHDEIHSGRWGDVKTVTLYNAEDWVTPNVGTWRHDPDICPGGFFFDASGHQLDNMFWLTGMRATKVNANVDNRGSRVPLVVTGTAELNNGAPVVFGFIGDAKIWREQINIHCEGADFIILQARAHHVVNGEVVPIAPDNEAENSVSAFVRMVRDSGQNWSPIEDARPIIRFTKAAFESASLKQEVHL